MAARNMGENSASEGRYFGEPAMPVQRRARLMLQRLDS